MDSEKLLAIKYILRKKTCYDLIFKKMKIDTVLHRSLNVCHQLQHISVNWTEKCVGTQNEKQPKNVHMSVRMALS